MLLRRITSPAPSGGTSTMETRSAISIHPMSRPLMDRYLKRPSGYRDIAMHARVRSFPDRLPGV
jgi:hypothetical protein